MFTSSSRGLSTKLLAVCGVLAVLSLSLVFAVGCASGGSEAQLQSGSAKVHTYNAAPDADVAARFFYSNVGDDQGTPWKEHRMVWSTADTTPSAAIGKIGLETAGAPTFTLSGNTSSTKYSQIKATADFYIVNNWDRAINVTGISAPDADLFYEVPPAGTFENAVLGGMGSGGIVLMPGWLSGAGGPFLEARDKLWAAGQTVDENYSNYFTAAGPVNGVRNTYLTSLSIKAPGGSIASGAKSRVGKVVIAFAARELPPPNDLNVETTKMITIAFSTYFGVTVDFTYTP